MVQHGLSNPHADCEFLRAGAHPTNPMDYDGLKVTLEGCLVTLCRVVLLTFHIFSWSWIVLTSICLPPSFLTTFLAFFFFCSLSSWTMCIMYIQAFHMCNFDQKTWKDGAQWRNDWGTQHHRCRSCPGKAPANTCPVHGNEEILAAQISRIIYGKNNVKTNWPECAVNML